MGVIGWVLLNLLIGWLAGAYWREHGFGLTRLDIQVTLAIVAGWWLNLVLGADIAASLALLPALTVVAAAPALIIRARAPLW
jgi:biotin transporter BioY